MNARHLKGLLPCPLVLTLAGCIVTPIKESILPPHGAEVIYEAGTKLGGCAVGDVMIERPGLEIVVVNGAGQVIVISREGTTWRGEVVLSTPGELIQVAVGDLLPDRPGDEILAGGIAKGTEDDPGRGATWLLARSRTGGGFDSQMVLNPSALTHALLVADLDPTRAGLEGVSAGFDRQVTLLAPDALDQCPSRVIANLPDAAKGIAAFDGGVAVACQNGELIWVGSGEAGFSTRKLARASSGLARLASGPEGLLASSNDGTFYHFTLDSTGAGLRREILRDPQNLKGRGAAWADLGLLSGPFQPGLPAQGRMAVTAGYNGLVMAVRSVSSTEVQAFELAKDEAAFHHVAAGDLLPEVPGDEVVAVGYSGKVFLISAR